MSQTHKHLIFKELKQYKEAENIGGQKVRTFFFFFPESATEKSCRLKSTHNLKVESYVLFGGTF